MSRCMDGEWHALTNGKGVVSFAASPITAL